MGKYRYIIFDADHTLIDFQKDERRAFRAALSGIPPVKSCGEVSNAGIPPIGGDKGAGSDIPLSDAGIYPPNADMPSVDEEIVRKMQAYSLRNWTELGLDDVNDEVIQREYHTRTYAHVRALFEHAVKRYGLEDAEGAARIFLKTLCLPANPIEDALQIVKALAEKYKVCIATNGLSEMQRGRLLEFHPYLYRYFISEEMNTIKPAEAFGKIMFDALKAGPEECLFIGDSLTSDIALANKLGMDCIWYNPAGRALPDGIKTAAQIKTLGELFKYI